MTASPRCRRRPTRRRQRMDPRPGRAGGRGRDARGRRPEKGSRCGSRAVGEEVAQVALEALTLLRGLGRRAPARRGRAPSRTSARTRVGNSLGVDRAEQRAVALAEVGQPGVADGRADQVEVAGRVDRAEVGQLAPAVLRQPAASSSARGRRRPRPAPCPTVQAGPQPAASNCGVHRQCSPALTPDAAGVEPDDVEPGPYRRRDRRAGRGQVGQPGHARAARVDDQRAEPVRAGGRSRAMPIEIAPAGRVPVVERHAHRGALEAGQVDEVGGRERSGAGAPVALAA